MHAHVTVKLTVTTSGPGSHHTASQMSYTSPRSAPTSPGHQPQQHPTTPPPSSTNNNNSSSSDQRHNNSDHHQSRRNSSRSFWTSGGGGGGRGASFDINQFTQNISNSLQDIFSNNLFNGDSLMDVRKMLNKTCNSCGTSFSVFLRKLFIFCPSAVVSQKRCQKCTLHFCHSCMEITTQRGVYRCKRCLVFAELPLTKDALNSLRVRDLKWYLSHRNISADTYSEKRELIDLIIAHVNPPPPQAAPPSPPPAHHHSRRGSSASAGSHQSQAHPRTEPSASSSQPPTPSHSQPPTPSHHQSSSVPTFAEPSSSASYTNLNYQDSGSSRQELSAGVSSRPLKPTGSNLSTSNNLNVSTFNLTDIKDESEIKDLSVRQLKLILTRNFVDFKGCVEREELIAKAILLYQDHQQSEKFKDENVDNVGIDENVCKICMENPIDCVLLECGHMLTCTACGKVLPECPVCRQFISRVVHVFKA